MELQNFLLKTGTMYKIFDTTISICVLIAAIAGTIAFIAFLIILLKATHRKLNKKKTIIDKRKKEGAKKYALYIKECEQSDIDKLSEAIDMAYLWEEILVEDYKVLKILIDKRKKERK